MAVKLLLVCNVILGRPTLNVIPAVISTFHQNMKFPTKKGVGDETGDQKTTRSCHVTSLINPKLRETLMVDWLDI